MLPNAPHTNALDLVAATPQARKHLEQLLESSDFLHLTTSGEHYPNSAGTGLPLLRLHTPLCSATVALQGAQLLDFECEQGEPLLWVSPRCNFSAGTALRGGIPICLPWFGPHPSDSKKPKHGFARNQPWQLDRALMLSNGSAELTFTFASPANALFEFDFTAQLTMILGKTAKLAITVTNTDSKAFACSWVLHSYHKVSSLDKVRVKGLAGKTYLDNLESHTEKYQPDDVHFSGEVDRIFPGVENELTIETSPRIAIKHGGCPSVVVWNPGAELAAKMADVGAGNEQHYICVERGAVLQEQWHLTAGESKSAWIEFAEIAE